MRSTLVPCLSLSLLTACGLFGGGSEPVPAAPAEAEPASAGEAGAEALVGARGIVVTRHESMDLSRPIRNVADDPDICAASETFLNTAQPAFGPMRPILDAPDKDAAFIGAVLHSGPDVRPLRIQAFPMVTVLPHELDWHQRRDELKGKFEAAIDALSEDARPMAHANYATLLLYMGEFQHVVDRYAPLAAEGKALADSGDIHFALAQAMYRLGTPEPGIPHARAAYSLLPKVTLDTRWVLMLVEMAAYGWDFYDRYSADLYDATHIRAFFPNDDWSALPFTDRTDLLGVDPWGGYGGASSVDLDGDGWDDLMLERKYKRPVLLRNNEGKGFEVKPQTISPLTDCGLVMWSPADIDNDGDPDIYRHCCNYDGWGPHVVAENQGDFTFADISEKAGLDNGHGSGSFSVWGDYDLDGNLDIAITDAYGPTRLYRNKGGGRFEETTAAAGIDTVVPNDPSFPGPPVFGGIGVSFGDYNDDGWPDLFVQGWDWKKLYRNKGDGTFEDVTVASGVGDGRGTRGYSNFFFDYDGDGDQDIFAGQYVVSSDEKWGFGPFCTCSNLLAPEGYSEREMKAASTILRNNGDGTFTDMWAETGFIPFGTMSSAYADWDNDGDLDLAFGAGGPYIQQAEPYLFYQNNGDGTFTNLTPFLMQKLWGKGHGITFNDFDHDGDLDAAIVNGSVVPGDQWPGLYLENRGGGGRWVSVQLRGSEGTNRDAIGAKVTVEAGGKRYVREVQSGGQFTTTNGLAVHFGLGEAEAVERIEIRWPDRAHSVTALTDVPADAAILVTQGTPGFTRRY